MRERIKRTVKKTVLFLLNPRFLLCFGIGWMITNGWSYLLFGIGIRFGIEWMIGVAGAYLAFLWLPVSPEKIVTVAIAILLLRLLFPKDEKTLAVLTEILSKAKSGIRRRRRKKDAAEEARTAKKLEDEQSRD